MPPGEPAGRTVARVADLAKRHEGKRIRIPDLQQPGTDFDAPHVTVRGRYYGRRGEASSGWWWVDVRHNSAGVLLLDTPLPASHPCFLIDEDPPPGPEPVEMSLFGD